MWGGIGKIVQRVIGRVKLLRESRQSPSNLEYKFASVQSSTLKCRKFQIGDTTRRGADALPPLVFRLGILQPQSDTKGGFLLV